jgi:hypothetical protein
MEGFIMLEIIKELYSAGYRFYLKDDILYLNQRNITEKKEDILNSLKNKNMREKIKNEISTFRQIKLSLNKMTLNEITNLMSNKYLNIINCDYDITNKTIILVYKILDGIDKRDFEYIKILSDFGGAESA